MSSNELMAMTVSNIRGAIMDYGAHTSQTVVLNDVSDSFITTLAADSIIAKRDLRELLSRSPIWDERLQSLVINGTRTHDPDYSRVHRLMYQILEQHIARSDDGTCEKIYAAMRFFDSPDCDTASSIAAIKELAPRAYRSNRKKSRVFKALCDALGVTDETKGSNFQQRFAMFADELNGRKLNFKLYLSINPAHFLTMSNPKRDSRGDMLTSCHSLNSTEYPYNCGCAGYARDDVTMIAFTVDNPDKPETLNNRKTSRQLFMYKVGNGLLLQSRLYNTHGGTYGAQKESALYRDLVQREPSELEGMPNLWKTYSYVGNEFCDIRAGVGFGGYQDWTYKDFDARISIRHDHAEDFKAFEVGTYGLCISCGRQIDSKLYCDECGSEGDRVCADCGERCTETYAVRDNGGGIIYVCWHCREDNYRICEHCDEYYPIDDMTCVGDGVWVCGSCLDEHYSLCDECDEYYPCDEVGRAINRYGCEIYICSGCRDASYQWCEHCEESVHEERMHTVHGQDCELSVCEDCRNNYYTECAKCGEYFHDDLIEDGLCPDCRSEE